MPDQQMQIGVVFPQTEIGSDPIAVRDYVQAAEQLELCAKVRLHCGPIVQAIHLKATPAASAGAPAEAPVVPTTQALQREVAALYGSSASLPAEQFRSWAVSCEPIFASLI